VSKAPLQIGFVNFTTARGNPYTTSMSMTTSIATQSLDYVACQNLRGDKGTTAKYESQMASVATSTVAATDDNADVNGLAQTTWKNRMIGEFHNLSVNNSPVYSAPLEGAHFLAALGTALESDAWTFNPDISSYEDWHDDKWAFITRLRLATDPVQDGVGFVTGLSTYGQQANINWTAQAAPGLGTMVKIPYMIMVHSSIVEILGNRAVNYIN
jgi:hypothetical protein